MSEGVLLAVIGVVGTLLGTAFGFGLSEWATRRREARAREDEEKDFALYAGLVEASKAGKVLIPAIGSDEHRRAERLATKGMFERLPGGIYAIPGQQFVIGTNPSHEKGNKK